MRLNFIERRLVDMQNLVIGGDEHRFAAALHAALRAGNRLFGAVRVFALGIGNDAAPFTGKCRHGTERA